MFNKLIDFGASLCVSYTAWIICSILFFAYLMGTEYKKVYSFHLEMRSSPSKNGKKSTILTDEKQIMLDKVLCYVTASFCLIVYSALCVKIALYLLGLVIMILSGILQVVVFIGLFILVVCILAMFL